MDRAFAIKLARCGRMLQVSAQQTVLEALLDAGLEVPSSCQQGVCGTCLTRVLEGEPEHRDLYLTAEEQDANDRFLPCCSRSRTPLLVIDL
jgi:vanillate O-demethylase ferredoxin subunit